jgi:hypothetical protein
MKSLRIILIIILVLYGGGVLYGGVMSLFNQQGMAELQKLGELTPGLEKSLIFSGAMLTGQAWLYFSAIMLLIRKMKEGYMYAVTLGFIELFQAIIIVAGLNAHHMGKGTDYIALVKGGLLLAIALIAFKKQPVN